MFKSDSESTLTWLSIAQSTLRPLKRWRCRSDRKKLTRKLKSKDLDAIACVMTADRPSLHRETVRRKVNALFEAGLVAE